MAVVHIQKNKLSKMKRPLARIYFKSSLLQRGKTNNEERYTKQLSLDSAARTCGKQSRSQNKGLRVTSNPRMILYNPHYIAWKTSILQKLDIFCEMYLITINALISMNEYISIHKEERRNKISFFFLLNIENHYWLKLSQKRKNPVHE